MLSRTSIRTFSYRFLHFLKQKIPILPCDILETLLSVGQGLFGDRRSAVAEPSRRSPMKLRLHRLADAAAESAGGNWQHLLILTLPILAVQSVIMPWLFQAKLEACNSRRVAEEGRLADDGAAKQLLY